VKEPRLPRTRNAVTMKEIDATRSETLKSIVYGKDYAANGARAGIGHGSGGIGCRPKWRVLLIKRQK
jgi:hypothetical protein